MLKIANGKIHEKFPIKFHGEISENTPNINPFVKQNIHTI